MYYLETLQRQSCGTDQGIRQMFRALLESACDDLKYGTIADSDHPEDLSVTEARILYRNAVAWIRGCPVARGYTFDFACTYLGIDVSAARKALLANVRVQPIKLRIRPGRRAHKMERAA